MSSPRQSLRTAGVAVRVMAVLTVVLAAIGVRLARRRRRALVTAAALVAAGALLLGLGLVIFFPWFLVAIWILVVSIGMFVGASRAPAPAV